MAEVSRGPVQEKSFSFFQTVRKFILRKNETGLIIARIKTHHEQLIAHQDELQQISFVSVVNLIKEIIKNMARFIFMESDHLHNNESLKNW